MRILIALALVMIALQTAGAIMESGDYARVWVGTGNEIITYTGKVTDVSSDEITMEVTGTYARYAESSIQQYDGPNPAHIAIGAITAWGTYTPEEASKSSEASPGFDALASLGLIAVVAIAIVKWRK